MLRLSDHLETQNTTTQDPGHVQGNGNTSRVSLTVIIIFYFVLRYGPGLVCSVEAMHRNLNLAL